MIPVYQTIFGETEGDCFRACVASIMETTTASNPNFKCCGTDGDNWFVALWQFLSQHNRQPLQCLREKLPVNDYSIVMGQGPRGHLHACVWWQSSFDGFVVHDPHPAGGGIDLTHASVRPVWITIGVVER